MNAELTSENIFEYVQLSYLMELLLLEKHKVMLKTETFSRESYQYLQNLLPNISQPGHMLEICLLFK